METPPNLIDISSIPSREEEALLLAEKASLVYFSPQATTETPNNTPNYRLFLGQQQIELQTLHKKNIAPIIIDFTQGKSEHRRRFGGGKGQDLAKAIGLNKFSHPNVLDLTAGFGKDAYVLASLGCHMTLIERSPLIYALLNDGLERARCHGSDEVKDILARMQLHNDESLMWLQRSTTYAQEHPDIIYFDPMFPDRGKQSKVKKDMQLLHDLVGKESQHDQIENTAIFDAARSIALKRVVIKRPRKAPFLVDKTPDFQVTGKSTRYDIYLPLPSQ